MDKIKKPFFDAQRKKKIKSFFIDLAVILVASSLGAFSTVAVMIPNGLTSGGVTGIVRTLQHFIPLDFSVLYYGSVAIILVLVWIFLGFKEMRKILMVSVIYPGVLFLFEQTDFQLLEEKDVLLAAVFCGIFTGLFCGLIFWRGYAMAGTDGIAKILRKRLFPQVSQSKIMLIIDGVVIIVSAFIFGKNIALYALITQVILVRVIDMVLYGFQSKVVQLEITTTKKKEIVSYIVNEINRGVSSHEISGEYSHSQFTQLRLLCSPRESISVKRKIAQIDPKAFVTVTQIEGVWGAGKGFRNIEDDL